MAGNGRFSQIQAPTTVVHSNLDQEIIQITEDRLRLALKDHIELVEEKRSWVAPLGILLAIITTFVTASFRKVYFEAATWQAVFIISGILSAVWLLKAVCRAYMSPSIDDVVDKIKSRSQDRKA